MFVSNTGDGGKVYDCTVIMREGSGGHGIVFGEKRDWPVVTEVWVGSEANKAGIEKGDKLTQVGGKDITNSAHLDALLEALVVDMPVIFRVLRY